ncbi:MAG: DNA repair protein RadA [Candidatus Nephthysia bennettiae]|uniref:DNA repair protein RadA n=1 Tax=Candidatus Nephthysia bennettiae TaxID=3127016 RepID=A0A934N9U4_9BACT|nr:DNA repair protein RadA [Candidatus Dormibacteraeota bacterium]MBJ7611984.1 DNA repair protein RadA [Candidatus Dormibacteraeota bacterium]PZR90836.1 MAG: DNA repair protein RadA [Candidatus Dormibacteraeota bacterium]
MPRPTLVFVCRECGGESIRWAGQCPHCRAWNTLEEFQATHSSREDRRPGRSGAAPAVALPITEVDVDAAPRLVLGWEELNRVLGGGVVPGSLVLVGGEPGVGKSTLLMHLAGQSAAAAGRVLYVSGEESAQQVGLRARRLGLARPELLMLAETDLDVVVATIDRESPVLVIVDSIQTVSDPSVEATPGSVSQVRGAAARLMRLAKDSGVPIFLVGHVTKEGAIAGPRVLEHMVDTVLYLEGERGQEVRILRATKNRFGSTEEIGLFAMTEQGMEELKDPSATLMGDLRSVPGAVVLAAMEGTRPLLVEVQSLVTRTAFGMPRRVSNGIDINRLHMIVAIAEKRARMALGNSDVFVNLAGGVRVNEPAADLGLALSLAGNLRDRALAAGTLVVGELGLAGEVRRVGRLDRRLQEAHRRGLNRAIVPAGQNPRVEGMELVEVRELNEAIEVAFPARETSSAIMV